MLKPFSGLGGTCSCGAVPMCSGSTDTCLNLWYKIYKGTSGTCKCGSSVACSGSTDTCRKKIFINF